MADTGPHAVATQISNFLLPKHQDHVLDHIKVALWRWLLAKFKVGLSKFYEWCVAPLECLFEVICNSGFVMGLSNTLALLF